LDDGRIVPMLPFRLFWICDGEFCGSIDLRFVHGSEALPPYVTGDVDYAVVPWNHRKGYTTRAGLPFTDRARQKACGASL
jgi:predicted acetyltransferase